MALARARRNETGLNYWPGFVDALSTLVLSIVFLLSVFLVVQFFLSQEVTGKDKALEQLNAKSAPASPPPKASATASRGFTRGCPAPAATPRAAPMSSTRRSNPKRR